MKFILATSVCIVLFPGVMLAQKMPANQLPFEDNTLQNSKQFTIMPYNRLIKSAGKVITYGDSTLENHSLDLTVLPGKKNIAIEDRYGIAILNITSNKIIARWSFVPDKDWNYLIS